MSLRGCTVHKCSVPRLCCVAAGRRVVPPIQCHPVHSQEAFLFLQRIPFFLCSGHTDGSLQKWFILQISETAVYETQCVLYLLTQIYVHACKIFWVQYTHVHYIPPLQCTSLMLFCYSALTNCIFYFAQKSYVFEIVCEYLHLCYRHCCALPDGWTQQVSKSSWLTL